MPNTLIHFEIPVNDPEKMSKFYSEAFGWNFQANPMGEGQTYWLISTTSDGKGLNGGMYKKMSADEMFRFYVGDEDLEAAITRFQNAGGSLINRFNVPGMVTGALMYDPEKNVVGIIKAPSRQSSQSRRSSASRGRSSSGNKKKKQMISSTKSSKRASPRK